MNNNIQVSVICYAYNHEKYIRQCLDGFVMQKDITFEVIIHDDASTDGTARIIREYEKKNPNIFKPIYQTENQYSKQIPMLIAKYTIPLITGKYVAICEGDDYWTDPYKLKKQYDALERNPDCLMCVHKVREINEDGSDSGYLRPREDISTSILPVGYICNHLNNAKFIHTSSFFFETNKYIEFIKNPPKFRLVSPGGDLPMLLYFNSIGKTYFINDLMSHYRFLSIGSYSYRNNNDPEKEIRMRSLMKKMRDMFFEYRLYIRDRNLDFDTKYIDEEIIRYDQSEYWYCIDHHDYKSLFEEFTTKELKRFGLDRKAMLKMKLQIWFPKVFKV